MANSSFTFSMTKELRVRMYCITVLLIFITKTSTNASTDRVEREKGAEEFP